MVSRRKLLMTGGASIVLLGGAAALFKTLHSDLTVARQPWRDAGQGFGDPRLDALSYAVLAPNPHNRQPWLVRLEGDDQLTLFCDMNRLLPETDPPNRQIVIGLGAFLELLRQAAAAQGYDLEITPFRDGEPHPRLDTRPVANVTFVRRENIDQDPLFGAVLDRRTVRTPFDQDRPVTDGMLTKIGRAVGADNTKYGWTNNEEQVAEIKQICRDGWYIEASTPRTHHESTELTRIGQKEVNAKPDGISLHGPVMEALSTAGILTREKFDDPESRAFEEGNNFYNGAIDTAMAFGWLSTTGNSRLDQLKTGADWVRLQLAATLEGLAMHPLSQVLQEFPEMRGQFAKIHDFTGVSTPARLQGLFRFGYAKFPAPAPRWPLTTRIIDAA